MRQKPGEAGAGRAPAADWEPSLRHFGGRSASLADDAGPSQVRDATKPGLERGVPGLAEVGVVEVEEIELQVHQGPWQRAAQLAVAVQVEPLQVCQVADLRWDLAAQLVVDQPQPPQVCEVAKLGWYPAAERVVAQVKPPQVGQVAELGRNAAAQLVPRQVELLPALARGRGQGLALIVSSQVRPRRSRPDEAAGEAMSARCQLGSQAAPLYLVLHIGFRCALGAGGGQSGPRAVLPYLSAIFFWAWVACRRGWV